MAPKGNGLTVADCIAEKGGTHAAAAAWGVTVESVCNWRRIGHFPARKYFIINESLRGPGRRKIQGVPPSLFKMDPPPSGFPSKITVAT